MTDPTTKEILALCARMADTMRGVLLQTSEGAPSFHIGPAMTGQIREDLTRAEALGVPVYEEGLEAFFADDAEPKEGQADAA